MTAEKQTDANGVITYKTIFVKPFFEVAADGTIDFYRVVDEKKQHFKTNLKTVSLDTIFFGTPISGFGHEMNFSMMKRIVPPVAIVSKSKTTPTKTPTPKMMAPSHLRGSTGGGGGASAFLDV